MTSSMVSSSADAAPSSASAEPALPSRAVRKDAARNYDALLAAAGQLYASKGVDCSLDEIARAAGVGIGTLYRHFPTRDALNEAVYRREVEALCCRVDDLRAENAPVEALAKWMRAFAAYVAMKRGMAAALKSALGPDNELFSHSHRRIREAIGTLLSAAAESGAIRTDVDADDLLRAMGAICMVADSPGWTEQAGRLIDLLVDGLRYGAPIAAK